MPDVGVDVLLGGGGSIRISEMLAPERITTITKWPPSCICAESKSFAGIANVAPSRKRTTARSPRYETTVPGFRSTLGKE